jgi:hypothetical protein
VRYTEGEFSKFEDVVAYKHTLPVMSALTLASRYLSKISRVSLAALCYTTLALVIEGR